MLFNTSITISLILCSLDSSRVHLNKCFIDYFLSYIFIVPSDYYFIKLLFHNACIISDGLWL